MVKKIYIYQTRHKKKLLRNCWCEFGGMVPDVSFHTIQGQNGNEAADDTEIKTQEFRKQFNCKACTMGNIMTLFKLSIHN